MNNFDLSQDYFSLFGFEPMMAIDVSLLQQRFQKLQNEYHPDKYSAASEQQSRQAMQISSLLNEAFQTLKDPIKRAIYLLQLNGIDLNTETDTRMDTAFLMEQMELREQMENIPQSEEGLDQIDQLSDQVKQQLKQMMNEVDEQIQASNWQQARDLLRKVQFMSKIQQECKQIQEKIEDGLF